MEFSTKFSNDYSQCADGESNKIVSDKKKLLGHEYLTPIESGINPINSKLIRIKKNFKKLKRKNQNIENARKNEKFAWCSTENSQLTEASQLVSAN